MDDMDRDDGVLAVAHCILVTPGIKPHHDIYTQYGNKCLSELSFRAIYATTIPGRDRVITIGVTGTNGKSTTTSCLAQLFEKIALSKPGVNHKIRL